MIRSLIGFLIIAVIFLAGMVVGSGKEEHHSIGDSIDSMEFNPESQEEPEIIDEEKEQYEAKIKQSKQETPEHFTQVVASSLESVVKGFYDMVVQLFYAFSNLFF